TIVLGCGHGFWSSARGKAGNDEIRMRRRIHGIQRARGACKTNRRGPVRCPKGEIIGVQEAGTRVPGDFDRGSKLKRVRPLGPGEIINKIVQRQLEIVTEGNPLVQTKELVPLLVGVADNPKALPGVSPMEGVDHGWVENDGVSQSKSFAVVGSCLHGSARV